MDGSDEMKHPYQLNSSCVVIQLSCSAMLWQLSSVLNYVWRETRTAVGILSSGLYLLVNSL